MPWSPGCCLDEPLDLGQTVGVVGDDLVEPAPQVGEAVLVGGQHLVDVQVLDLQQGLQVLAEGVGELLGVDADVGRDPGQDVVARRQQPVALAVEADVTGGVAGGPHRLQVPARDVDACARLRT